MPTNSYNKLTRWFPASKRKSNSTRTVRNSSRYQNKRRKVPFNAIRFRRQSTRRKSKSFTKRYRRRASRSTRNLFKTAVNLQNQLQLPQTYTTDFANVQTAPATIIGHGKPAGYIWSNNGGGPTPLDVNSIFGMTSISALALITIPNATSNVHHLNILSARRRETIMNASNSPADVTCFKIMARRDMSSGNSFLTDYTTGLDNLDYSGFTGAQLRDQDKYSFFQSAAFTSRWKILSVTKFHLDGGESKNVTTIMGPRVYPLEHLFFQNSGSDNFDIAYRRCDTHQGEIFNVYKFSGVLGKVAGNITLSSYTSPELQLSCQTTYVTKQLNTVRAQNVNPNAIGYASSSTTNVQFIEDDSGDKVTQVNV